MLKEKKNKTWKLSNSQRGGNGQGVPRERKRFPIAFRLNCLLIMAAAYLGQLAEVSDVTVSACKFV